MLRRVLVSTIAFLILAGGAFYVYRSGAYHRCASHIREIVQGKKYNKQASPARSLIEKNIFFRLHSLDIPDSNVSTGPKYGDSSLTIRAVVPQGKPREVILWNLSAAAAGTGYTVEDCLCPDNARECTLRFAADAYNKPGILLVLTWSAKFFSKTARLAIVVNDFGFTADRTTVEYLSLPYPLTVALAPSRKLSSWTAQISNEYKKEIAILLPMEPVIPLPPSYRPSYIMLHYPPERVRQILNAAVSSVPNFSGFSNMGGARILEDSRVTEVLFSEIRKRHAYFLETPVSKKSVAPVFAVKYGVPIIPVDCIVDSRLTAAQVQELLRKSAREAQHRGSYIISTAATAEFIGALKKILPDLQKNGVSLSYVSDIAGMAGGRKK